MSRETYLYVHIERGLQNVRGATEGMGVKTVVYININCAKRKRV